jgi:hypothetical protein
LILLIRKFISSCPITHALVAALSIFFCFQISEWTKKGKKYTGFSVSSFVVHFKHRRRFHANFTTKYRQRSIDGVVKEVEKAKRGVWNETLLAQTKEKSKSNAIFRITDALLSLFPGNANAGNQMSPHTGGMHPSGSAVAALPVIREMILIL